MVARDLNESNASLDELSFGRHLSKTSIGSTTTISTTGSNTSRGDSVSLASSKASSNQLTYKVRIDWFNPRFPVICSVKELGLLVISVLKFRAVLLCINW